MITLYVLAFIIASLLYRRRHRHIDMRTVRRLELERYMGRWYEIARYDRPFERRLRNIEARYTLRADGNVEMERAGIDIRTGHRHTSCRHARRTQRSGRLRVKNFIPAISVEGFEAATDGRRGEGTFRKVTRAMELLQKKKLPFGIGQIGKSFRNEITPGNFIFRVREFEQMELEFFCKPGTDLEWFQYWRTFCHNWLLSIGLKDENLRLRDHDPEELCFYSKATTDFEFLFPFGWGELWGVADRTDYDLTQHQNTSGVKMVYREGEGKDMVEYVPYVIEPSLGVERSVLAVLCDAYDEEVVGQDKKGNDDVRVVLHFHPALAPFKAAILPLSKKDVLAGPAMELYNELSKEFMVDYDETGSIGKRYRREDEIGTPYCITFDFDTVGDEANGIAADHCVTIRERDSMEQVRIPIDQVKDFLREKCAF